MGSLEKKYCPDGHSKVDFDLALKQLEESSFLKTGPLVPYTNPPGSSVVAIGSFSKREFIRLTEKGYKAAQKSKTRGSGSETMKVRELVSSIEKFHHDLESHFDLWQQSLGQPLPEYPVRNIQGLKEQVNNVARQLGKLRPYIQRVKDTYSEYLQPARCSFSRKYSIQRPISECVLYYRTASLLRHA